jgi:two-component system OmpR family sensor kinase
VSLRRRVVLSAAIPIVAAVVALALAVPALLRSQLSGALDDTLRSRAVEVARLAASAPGLLTDAGALEGRLGGGALYVQVVDKRGRIVARSSDLGARVLPPAPRALRDRRSGYADAHLGTEAIRLYSAPLGELGNGEAAGGAVLVAGTTSSIDATVHHARGTVLGAALIAALLGAALAALLAARALRPLRRLSTGARAIERSGDHSGRLPAPSTHDEVGELAETLNAMLASLERSQEAERRFVGDASHELRTPLTALRGNAAYVARHGADPAALADLEADAARLSALLDDLLALAREDASAPVGAGGSVAAARVRGEPVDLLAVAAQVADAGTVVEGEPSLVLGERPALERAVGNLVRNARKHGPEGGTIHVGVSEGRVEVADEGPGLTPEEAAHAFERFWRGPGARGEGSGLGLAIVRAIAERHGGRISVEGARFTLELPPLKNLSKDGRTTASTPKLSLKEPSP